MKKIQSRALCILLCFVILFSIMNVGAFAASYTQITLGEKVLGSSDLNYGKLSLEFVPEESGYYAFYSEGDSDTCGYIFDSSMDLISENDDYEGFNFCCISYMEAGNKYILRSELYSNDGEGEYYVSIIKTEIAESVFIYHGGENFGYVDGYITLECMSEPETAFSGTCFWESDNENVAYVEYFDDNMCEIYCVSEGCANITVTTDTGLSDTVEVRVIDTPYLQVDFPEYLSFGVDGGNRQFVFTPEKTGDYAVYTSGATSVSVEVTDGSGEYIDQYYSYIDSEDECYDMAVTCSLQANTDYYIFVDTYGPCSDFELCVTMCPPLEGVKILSYGAEQAIVGDMLYFAASFLPTLAMAEECIWSVDNDSIASVIEDYDGCAVVFSKPGSAILTVTTERGFTDSLEIVCKDAEIIRIGETKTGYVSDAWKYKFVPDEFGYYTFLLESEASMLMMVEDEVGNYVAGGIEGIVASDITITQALLDEDSVYYISAYTLFADDSITYSLRVGKTTSAENLFFCDGNERYCYVGEYIDLPVMLAPETAYIEECEFYSSDEGVAVIDYYGSNGCSLEIVGEGVATITAVSENGLTATCTVNAKEPVFRPLILNEELTVNTEKFSTDYFEFTPEEDGLYSFLSIGDTDTVCYLVDEYTVEIDYDDDSGEDNNFNLIVEMKAGETYRFVTQYYAKVTDSYSVMIVKARNATSVVVGDEKVVYVDVGDSYLCTAEFLPVGSIPEEVNWRVSSRDILELLVVDETACIVLFNEEGIATLEAYTDSGLYGYITIVVGDSVKNGDVNGDGDVNAVDTNMLKRYIAGVTDDIVFINSDMNADGIIDSRDSNILKRAVAGQ